MKLSTIVLFLLGLSQAAPAEKIESAYTELDLKRGCDTFATSQKEDGDWGEYHCSGYKAYPIIVFYSDARESLFYGFPRGDGPDARWESFSGFNSTGPTVEWRIAKEGGREIPFATIHRWFVDGQDGEVQVLVIEKVAQPREHEGCAVGYVVATGNARANEKARRIADERARSFICGVDRPTVNAGEIPLPALAR